MDLVVRQFQGLWEVWIRRDLGHEAGEVSALLHTFMSEAHADKYLAEVKAVVDMRAVTTQ